MLDMFNFKFTVGVLNDKVIFVLRVPAVHHCTHTPFYIKNGNKNKLKNLLPVIKIKDITEI
jgi:hypothetical protein